MATIIEAQVDWLTLTSRDASDLAPLSVLGASLAAQEAKDGNRITPWRWLGYVGSHAGRASVGTGPQGTILRLSGDLADRAFDSATEASDHISRLDIAATVRLDCQDWRYEARRWGEYQHWLKEHAEDHAGQYHEDARGSASTYIGSRTSECLLRVYNKEGECKARHDPAELERYRNCHRWELELKNARAGATVAALAATPRRDAAVLGWIAGYSDSRGLSTLDLTLGKLKLCPGFRRRTDTDSKLGWLSSQVAPTMRWLVDHGQTESVIRVLDLDLMEDTGPSQKMGARRHR